MRLLDLGDPNLAAELVDRLVGVDLFGTMVFTGQRLDALLVKLQEWVHAEEAAAAGQVGSRTIPAPDDPRRAHFDSVLRRNPDYELGAQLLAEALAARAEGHCIVYDGG